MIVVPALVLALRPDPITPEDLAAHPERTPMTAEQRAAIEAATAELARVARARFLRLLGR